MYTQFVEANRDVKLDNFCLDTRPLDFHGIVDQPQFAFEVFACDSEKFDCKTESQLKQMFDNNLVKITMSAPSYHLDVEN